MINEINAYQDKVERQVLGGRPAILNFYFWRNFSVDLIDSIIKGSTYFKEFFVFTYVLVHLKYKTFDVVGAASV